MSVPIPIEFKLSDDKKWISGQLISSGTHHIKILNNDDGLTYDYIIGYIQAIRQL